MIIGFDASRAFVKDKTGTEIYSYELLRSLAKIDTVNNYLVYIRSGQQDEIKKDKWPENFKFSEINFPRFWTQLGLSWRTFIDSIDVLFVPSHTLPLIRKPNLKTVITVHDLGAEYLPSSHQFKQVLYLNLMTHYQLKTASKIIAVSKATKEDIIKKVGLDGKNIEVIYEGINEKVFSRQPLVISKIKSDTENNILKRLDIDKQKYFLFVGTIQPRKNLERVIRAFNRFLASDTKDDKEINDYGLKIADSKKRSQKNQKLTINNRRSKFKLVLAGQKGWKSDRIYSLPKELGIEKNVVFLGRVNDSELSLLYKNAVALVFVSLFEGFGLPILEAFASGCPVITSRTSSMPEVAGDAALIVDPYNESEITKSMQVIVENELSPSSNKKLRDSLIYKGYIRVREFSWDLTAVKTVKIFKELKQE